MPAFDPYATGWKLPMNNTLPAADPGYSYTHGNRSLLNDVAQFRARLAGGARPFDEKNQYGTAHEVGHTPLLGHVSNAFGYDQRKALAIFAALMAGGAAGAGAFGGAGAAGAEAGTGAGSAAGSAGATGAGLAGSAATVDPFLADLGLGSTWGPVAAGAGAGGLTTGLGSESASGGGFYDPGGTFHAGTAAGDFGAMSGRSSFLNSPWAQMLIKSGGGGLISKLFGGQTGAERSQSKLSSAPFESSDIQRFLPPALRNSTTGPTLEEGMRQLAELIRNPGGMSPTVADAIRPRLAAESQSIAQNYRNLQSQNSGAAARGNAPVSIKNALSSALDVAQERAQRGARTEALAQSETLRREDLQQVYALLDTILQFTGQGRGQAIAGLGAASEAAQRRQAAILALIGSLLSNQGSGY